jgi:hypothetical protein
MSNDQKINANNKNAAIVALIAIIFLLLFMYCGERRNHQDGPIVRTDTTYIKGKDSIIYLVDTFYHTQIKVVKVPVHTERIIDNTDSILNILNSHNVYNTDYGDSNVYINVQNESDGVITKEKVTWKLLVPSILRVDTVRINNMVARERNKLFLGAFVTGDDRVGAGLQVMLLNKRGGMIGAGYDVLNKGVMLQYNQLIKFR